MNSPVDCPGLVFNQGHRHNVYIQQEGRGGAGSPWFMIQKSAVGFRKK